MFKLHSTHKSTVMTQRHVCTQEFAFQLNSVPYIKAILTTEHRIQ